MNANSGKCNDHRDRPTVRTCPTCKRIRNEKAVVERTVTALLAHGYQLNVNNGGDDYELPAFTTDRAAVLAAMMETDDELLVTKDPRPEMLGPDAHGNARNGGWVRFVYGNSGEEVINDYTLNLEDALATVNAYAEGLA
jgi:hypothetical protein